MQGRRHGRRPAGLTWGTVAAAIVLVPPAVSAQLGSADYTAAEADAGEPIYEQMCATCHMSNLTGSFEAPELAGPTFRGTWEDRTVEELIELVQVTMPPGAGGSLAPEEYASVVAYILRENGVAAGTVALGGVTAPRWRRRRGGGWRGRAGSGRWHAQLPARSRARARHRRDAARSRPGRLADLPADLRRLGPQPPRPDRPRQRRRPAARLGLVDGRRSQPADPARLRRRDVPRQPRQRRPGPRRRHRHLAVGVPPPPARRAARCEQPQPRHLRRQAVPGRARRPRGGPRQPHRRARLGDPDGRLQRRLLELERPHRGERAGRQRHQRLLAVHARQLLHHRPRRRHRRGAVAAPHHRRPRRPRRRHLGRPAVGPPGRRRLVDSRQLRPRARPPLLARRPGQAVGAREPGADRPRPRALHQLDPRPEPRRRLDPLVPPARARRGPRPRRGVRAGAGGERGAAGRCSPSASTASCGSSTASRGRSSATPRPCSRTCSSRSTPTPAW